MGHSTEGYKFQSAKQIDAEQKARIKELEEENKILLKGMLDIYHNTNETAIFKAVRLHLDAAKIEVLNSAKINS